MRKINDTLAKRHGRYAGLWMAFAALLLCTGCSEETSSADQTTLGRGQVMVDYMVGENPTRSVSHETLAAHERIKSLVYLLYNDGGELVKKREIPDISSMGEGDWPMKRSTMTWKQREALKDTLEQGRNYTAVFIANADPTLFGGEEVLHLTKTEGSEETAVTLDEVYLSLPTTTAFNDHNMFYLCVEQIASDGYDRDHHYDCPITLQRIVSRTDFFSDDYPAWDTEFTEGKIRAFTDNKVYDVLTATDGSNKKPLGIDSWLNSFLSDFYSFATAKAYLAVSGFTDWYNNFKSAMNGLDYSTYITNMPDTDKEAVQTMLYNDCRAHETLKGLWQPWKGLQAKVVYSSCADRFYVSGKTAKVGDATATAILSPFLNMIQKETTNTDGSAVTQNTFTLIGFGENAETTTGNELNKMTAVQLYESATATTSVATISMTDNVQSFAEQGGNERMQLVYCPIKTLTYNSTYTTGKTYDLVVDIKSSILSAMNASGSDYETQSEKLGNFLADDAGKKYGESLEKFVLRITLPDLSQPEALMVTSEWSVKE